MNEFIEIAYAAASNSLCLFTGTGFSKAVTNNAAPSWKSMLESLCDLTENPFDIQSALFPVEGNKPLSLEEAAQVISIELLKSGKNLNEEIAKIIKSLKLVGDNSDVSNFLSRNSLRIVTTNYDKLAEELVGGKNCHAATPGLPIPRSHARVMIYHIHGSIDSPENMIVTSDNYFKFINNESYFSRKLSTILHENTVVILGYSLGDTNLKAILSDYRVFSRNCTSSSNIFFVSRSAVNQHVKDYYSHCYGIRVLDKMEVRDFFKQLNKAMPDVEKNVAASLDSIKNVLESGHTFTDSYLRIESSFFEIIASLAAIGKSINDESVVSVLGTIIQKKIDFTKEQNAWEQYEHLARWLIYLGSILDLKGITIKNTFLEATLKSMSTMSREQYKGYSWHAFESWNDGWSGIIASNRAIIRDYIVNHNPAPDALMIVNQG
jgi:hypothetical protein